MKNLFILSLAFFTLTATAQRSKFKIMKERNGMIGIGTSTPDQLLTVKGKIHTQEVLVDLKGAVAPDYVFEHYFEGESELNPTYTFPSLEEVSSFIKTNNHLPGIPSANVLKEEGLALKEMNLLLLQKIEELTLYAIEQQIELEALKETVAKLED